MRSHQKAFRSGMSLIELLIVISIMTLLMQLIVPAVQNAREAARRTQCANNLRQAAMAVVNYEAAEKQFPPGYVLKPRHNFVQYVLPYMEQKALFEQYDFEQDWNSEPNDPVTENELPLLQCPTAPRDYPFLADYGVCVKVGDDLTKALLAEGLIRDRQQWQGLLREGPVEARVATDGLSNTILLCETGGRPDKYVLGRITKTNVITGSRWGTPAGRFDLNYRCGAKMDEGSQIFNCTSKNEIYSFHPGAANFVFADASVRVITDDVAPDVLISLITASAGD